MTGNSWLDNGGDNRADTGILKRKIYICGIEAILPILPITQEGVNDL